MTPEMIEAASIAFAHVGPNLETTHFPGDVPRKWRAASGAVYDTRELSSRSAERLRVAIAAALAAAEAAAWQPSGADPRGSAFRRGVRSGLTAAIRIVEDSSSLDEAKSRLRNSRECFASSAKP